MKKISLSLLALAGVLVTAESRAASINGVVNAEIVAPLEIVEDTQMDFGTLSTDGTPETVVMDNAGSVTCPSTMYCDGSTDAGVYTITGAPNGSVDVTVSDAVLSDGSGNTMSLTNDYGIKAGETLDGTGELVINVGGELAVAGDQATGIYSTSSVGGTAMTIDVNY
ncbi:MAG: DUF4402 domain-containing protein [Alphaproteobacteria bacterium]|jgi:hypothetical protein|nr:DUF4402 domain-containing protein [Alphaproteobacteria bacterium]